MKPPATAFVVHAWIGRNREAHDAVAEDDGGQADFETETAQVVSARAGFNTATDLAGRVVAGVAAAHGDGAAAAADGALDPLPFR
jgi:hypothetical protein